MSLLRLQQMIDSGKTYYYHDQTAVIKSFDNSHAEIEIIVEIYGEPKKFIKQSEEKIGLFLECFKEVPIVTEAEEMGNLPAINKPKTEVPLLFMETKIMFAALAQGLVDDIEKTRTDATYIPRAKQVCNNVNSIVNIAKLQFQLLHQKE